MELDFSALSPPNSIVIEELSNGGYSSPFQLSPMSSNQQQQQQHVPSNQEKVIKTFKRKPPKAIMCFHMSISLGKHDQT